MPTVLYEKRGKIAYVTINRPEVRNCIDPATHDLMWQIWEDFDADEALQLAILTGAGEAFCAGADLKAYIPPLLPGTALTPRSRLDQGFCGITRGLHRIYKPILAAVNGWALAGGLELALACDMRIASERAQLGSFEVRRGYHHGDGGIVRLVNIAGAGAALEMLLTGEPVDAERALRLNLVSRVVPHEKLMEETEAVAATILRNDSWAIRSAKETILDVIGRPLDDQLRIECLNGYSGAGNPTVKARLEEFYQKSDAGRAGSHATSVETRTPSKT
jgi:enoyl-CoA hydratase/carnithine racemase